MDSRIGLTADRLRSGAASTRSGFYPQSGPARHPCASESRRRLGGWAYVAGTPAIPELLDYAA